MSRIIGYIDTAISSVSLGDQIIVEKCLDVIDEIYPHHFKTGFPAHAIINSYAKQKMEMSDNIFVFGTNILCYDVDKYKQWNSDFYNNFKNKPILLGCGWHSYSDYITEISKKELQNVLNEKYYHSTRDQYTLNKLKSIGIKNVINTSCPTLWSCDEQIIGQNSDSVVFTLHYGYENHHKDRKFVEFLINKYEDICLWPQGYKDIEYFMEFANKDIYKSVEILEPNLKTLDKCFEYGFDYFGVRLHSGIRAIQHNCSSNIIAIDNRAKELICDIGGHVYPKDDLEYKTHDKTNKIKLNLPVENIEKWLRQFTKEKNK